MSLAEFMQDAGRSDAAPHLPQPHLSVSQLQMWNRCPEQYRQRYVLGRKERPGAALIVGSAFHKTVEQDFGQKMATGGDLLPDKEVVEAYHGNFDREVERAGGVTEVAWDVKEKPDTARLHGQAVTELFHTVHAPRMHPDALEWEFRHQFESVPVPIVGMLDFVGQRDQENGPSATFASDYKTASRAQRSLKPEWVIQGEMYHVASGLPIEWIVAVKGSKPSIITHADAPGLYQLFRADTAQHVERTFRHTALGIAWAMQTYGPDEPWPTQGFTHPWGCSFCGFKNNCAAWGNQ